MGGYSEAEKLVLLAGMTGGQPSVWTSLSWTVESLAERGLVETTKVERPDGTIESIPIRLSELGLAEARRLQQGSL
jgi:hypothetical protein